MGGFRVNGIGATDHFKKLMSLGVHKCPNCGMETEFFLELAKFKIDIVFIPTVTLKKRYAVMCSRCEKGWIVQDELAESLLNGQTVSVSNKICPKCAAQNKPEALFCSQCGTKLS